MQFTGLLSLVGALALQTPATSQPVPVADPLFESHDVIDLQVVGPIREIRDDRAEEPEYRETMLHFAAPDGSGQVSARVRARGNFRKQKSTCRHMPPLRVNLRKKEVEGTLFEGQDKLKLVTHCRDGEDYEQNVLKEYLAYRLYNVITDESFRVRMARITYTDDTGRDDEMVRYGFFIEDEDRMAERLAGALAEMDRVHPYLIAGDVEPRIALFQYAIGNTDFSLIEGHNAKVVRRENGEIIPVPYDFDWSGLVSARYARPSETLPIRHVRQRLYRGFCHDAMDATVHVDTYAAAQARWMELGDEIEGWKEDDLKKTKEYLSDFFEVLADPNKVERELVRACRQVLG